MMKLWLLLGLFSIINLVPAAPYPDKVMKWTATEKLQQRQAGKEILQKIHDAIKNNLPGITIPTGVYRFTKTEKMVQPSFIVLRNVKNFVINGSGAWFYFERQATAFRFFQCDNLTLKNINIDYDPLPYIQGTVVAFDDNSPPTLTFKPDDGYKMPELLLNSSQSWRQGQKKRSGTTRMLLWDKETKLIKANQNGMDISAVDDAITALKDGTYRVKTWVFWGEKFSSTGIKIGDPISLWRRAGRVIRLELCGKIILDNVNIYASGFVAYTGYHGDGPYIIRNCKLERRAGTNRLMSSNADGINIRGIKGAAIIENCKIEALGDDCLNLHGVYYKVFEQLNPTEIIVPCKVGNEYSQAVWHFSQPAKWLDQRRPGAKLSSWKYLGKSKVISLTTIEYTIPHNAKINKRYKAGKVYKAFKVKLSSPIKVDVNSIFWSESAIVKGSIVRNNIFRNNLARSIRLQTINCLIENNKISNSTHSALTLYGQPGYWGEAANCQNITIRNNVFTDSGRSSGSAAVVMTVSGNPLLVEPISNIVFKNNQIIRPRGSAIELAGCKQVKIINNTVSGLKNRPYVKDHNSLANYIDPKSYGKPFVQGAGLVDIKLENNKIIK
jgi:hypothetical protein